MDRNVEVLEIIASQLIISNQLRVVEGASKVKDSVGDSFYTFMTNIINKDLSRLRNWQGGSDNA